MRHTILEELESDGFVVIDDFLTEAEIEELKSAARDLCREAPKEDRKVFNASSNPSTKSQNKEQYFLNSGDKICYFYEENALDKNGELVVEPELALNKIGHALHTDHPIFNSVTFSNQVKELCWLLGYKKPAIPQSMYVFKNPGVGGEVKSHQDSTYLYTEPNSVIGFWIALDNATQQNGCLQFIRGSHKSGTHRRYIRNPDLKSDELLIYDQSAPIYPVSNFTSVPVAKGSCVLIHSQVVHKSDPNRSDESRHAYTFHVIETDKTEYAKENWLQAPAEKPFPILYETKD